MGLVEGTWPITPRPDNSPAWKDVAKEKRDRFDHIMAIYAAVIDTMDRSVGTLVDGLEERGVLENTLILFLSDNGGNAESGPDGKYQGEQSGRRGSNVFLGQNWATLSNTFSTSRPAAVRVSMESATENNCFPAFSPK